MWVVIIGNNARLLGPITDRRVAARIADQLNFKPGRWQGYTVQVAELADTLDYAGDLTREAYAHFGLTPPGADR